MHAGSDRAAGTTRELNQLRAVHDAIVAAALDCIITIDADGRVVGFNPAAEAAFGYSRAEAIGREMGELIVPPHLREAHRRGVARLLASGEPRILNRRVEIEAMRRDGTVFPVELTVTQLAADPPLFSGHIRDISDRKLAEANQQRLAAIVDSTQDAVIAFDHDGRITAWNAGARELYGYDLAEITEFGVDAIVPADRAEELRSVLARVLAGERVERIETRRRTKSGRMIDVAVTLSPIVDRAGRVIGASSIARDIGERKRFEETLRHQADHDPLTGLVNRRVFVGRLAECAERGGNAAVIYLDLDHFKLVNDLRGHRAGDDLLRVVAEAVRGGVRAADTVARLGGDEFAVLLDGCGEAQALDVAGELLRRVARCAGTANVAASAGVVAVAGGAGAEDVMVAADMALYEAKSAGRGCVRRYNGSATHALRTVARVKDAIASDRLVLHAQPIVELAGGRVVRHELLVRMLGEDGRLVPPSEFIPIAERFGLIGDIDRWVIARGAQLARGGMPVAVNLSASSLGDAAVARLIHDEIDAGVPAGGLSFEITETSALSDVDTARDFAQRLAGWGCSLALDDFGTGFGSLMHLKHLPVTTLKIDMEFVQNLIGDLANRRIVEALIAASRVLGQTTVAEGVEDAATLELLRELGVDQAQGFHVGRPAPIA
jgi:diguanylate cyclase (GGDEF)-like protein/PAS domain S-box-containing protein